MHGRQRAATQVHDRILRLFMVQDILKIPYVALGKYEDALNFTDKMVEYAPWYMRNRYKQMISELKERMADAAK